MLQKLGSLFLFLIVLLVAAAMAPLVASAQTGNQLYLPQVQTTGDVAYVAGGKMPEEAFWQEVEARKAEFIAMYDEPVFEKNIGAFNGKDKGPYPSDDNDEELVFFIALNSVGCRDTPAQGIGYYDDDGFHDILEPNAKCAWFSDLEQYLVEGKQLILSSYDNDEGVESITEAYVAAFRKPIPPKQATCKAITINPTKGELPLTVNLTVDHEDALQMRVTWGDGSDVEHFDNGIFQAEHTYTSEGTFSVTVEVLGEDGVWRTADACQGKVEITKTPPPPVCEETTVIYGKWSEWSVDPNDPTKEFRTREVKHVDIHDESVVCKTETEREERPVVKPPVCEQTTPIYGTWSEWQTDPDNPEVEFRTRTVTHVDINDESIICDIEEQREQRTVETPLCEETTVIYGKWSEWSVDPNDPTKEFRTREVKHVDVNDNSVVCDSETEREERPFERVLRLFIPFTKVPLCLETTRVEGQWSEWEVDPEDFTKEFRIRVIKFVDVNDETVTCDSEIEREERDAPPSELIYVSALEDPLCNTGELPAGEYPDEPIEFDLDEAFPCPWPVDEENFQSALKFPGGEIFYKIQEYGTPTDRYGSIITAVSIKIGDGPMEVLPRPANGYIEKMIGHVQLFVEPGECTDLERPSRCLNPQIIFPKNLSATGLVREMFAAVQAAKEAAFIAAQ